MKKFLVIVMALVLNAQMSFAGDAVESARCSEANDSLDAEQAKGRNGWAMKCFPHIKYMASTEDGNFYLKNTATGERMIAYPIFVSVGANGLETYVQAPIDPAADCWDMNTFFVAGFCRAGCFTPEQEILFENGYLSILDGLKNDMTSVVTFAGLRDGNMTYRSTELYSYTADLQEKNQPILLIKTQFGGQLRVTPTHPLVDGRGYMVDAESLKVGDSLMNMDGVKEPIASIERIDYFGKVYNIEMGTDDIEDNIIVANGYLSGTVYYQNEGLENLNRLVLRESNILTNLVLK